MKFKLVITSVLLIFVLQSPTVFAGKLQDYRGEADQYYTEQDFRKAYKIYYKLAKIGDHYAQDKLANIYANGDGKKVDIEEAYAWSVLAAEGGDEMLVKRSEELFELSADKSDAEEKATKLKQKYGQVALQEKANKKAAQDAKNQMRGCTGSRLGCSGG